jgi:hypothetical protein
MAENAPSPPAAADLLAYVDEAGHRGMLRNLASDQDDRISVLCALPIPAELNQPAIDLVEPPFRRFVSAAPPNAKLHIADAFLPGNEAWAKVAHEVRDDLFALIHTSQFVVVYVARRFGVARSTFELGDNLAKEAKKAASGRYTVSGADRPSDDRIEDDLVQTMALMLDGFAEQASKQRVDVLFDQIDDGLAMRYTAAFERTRNISGGTHAVKGWDKELKQRVSGSIQTSVERPEFRLDTAFLGEIIVVGKDNPLVFAADVVANSLWRHLGTLPAEAALNDGAAVANWPLGDRVWGKDAPKNFDSF